MYIPVSTVQGHGFTSEAPLKSCVPFCLKNKWNDFIAAPADEFSVHPIQLIGRFIVAAPRYRAQNREYIISFSSFVASPVRHTMTGLVVFKPSLTSNC